MSVPFPTPEGPVITKIMATGWGAPQLAAAHERDKLAPLALGEPADRLAW